MDSGFHECVHNGVAHDSLAKWADQACDGLKFIDEDYEDDTGIIRIRYRDNECPSLLPGLPIHSSRVEMLCRSTNQPGGRTLSLAAAALVG